MRLSVIERWKALGNDLFEATVPSMIHFEYKVDFTKTDAGDRQHVVATRECGKGDLAYVDFFCQCRPSMKPVFMTSRPILQSNMRITYARHLMDERLHSRLLLNCPESRDNVGTPMLFAITKTAAQAQHHPSMAIANPP